MYGAIIGDIVGSVYEFHPIKTKVFPFFSAGCSFTDDTAMTVAVAKALMKAEEDKSSFKHHLIVQMRKIGSDYPLPMGGYGLRFRQWLTSVRPEPYHSFGNGSAMRVSPCGLFAVTLEEALALAKASAEVTHDHPEGVKGAQATAAAVYLANNGKSKEEIRAYIEENFYALDQTLEEIRPSYGFDETCQGTVPQAIIAFLESTDYEDAVRNAVSLGGDSDTIGAITGSIAWAYYKRRCPESKPFDLRDPAGDYIAYPMMQAREEARRLLPQDFVDTIEAFAKRALIRAGTYYRAGRCPVIPTDKWASRFSEPFVPLSVEHVPLMETIRKKSDALLRAFRAGEDTIRIQSETWTGVWNYDVFLNSYERIAISNKAPKDALSLEECFIILTIIWRYDYARGGGPLDEFEPVFEYCRRRIVELLSMYA